MFVCHHCSTPLEGLDDPSITISRSGGGNLKFHLKCFEEIAGPEYIPASISSYVDIEKALEPPNWSSLGGLLGGRTPKYKKIERSIAVAGIVPVGTEFDDAVFNQTMMECSEEKKMARRRELYLKHLKEKSE